MRHYLLSLSRFSYYLYLSTSANSHVMNYRIDAVCIDQQHIPERTSQVSMMWDIYSMAECVLVFLKSKDAAHGSVDMKPLFQLIDKYVHRRAILNLKFSNEAQIAALKELSHCRWFERLWIVQEVYAARRVVFHYGLESFEWGKLGVPFEEMMVPFEDSPLVHKFRPSTMLPLWCTQGLTMSREGDLLDLIHNTSMCMATDPRDRIFALRGLMKSADKIELEPNYNLSVYAVLRMATEHLIETNHNLDVLAFASGVDADGPSWILASAPISQMDSIYHSLKRRRPLEQTSDDITIRFSNYLGHGLRDARGQADIGSFICTAQEPYYRGPGPFRVQRPHEVERSMLYVQAHWLESITHVHNASSILASLVASRIDNLFSSEFDERYFSCDLPDKFVFGYGRQRQRIIPMGIHKDILTRKSPQTLLERAYLAATGASSSAMGYWTWPCLVQYVQLMFNLSPGRQFLVTRGAIGVGPMSARPGDELFQIQGAIRHLFHAR